MIFRRDNVTRIFGQVSIIWKKVASLMSVSSLFVCAFLALPRTAPKIAPKGRENSSPLIAGMAMGNVIRTQMASKEQNYSNSSVEHICSTSGRTDIPAQNKDGIGHESKQEAIETSKFGQSFTAKAEKEEIICLISKIDAGAPGITGTSSVPDAVRSSIQKRESKYNKLFDTWLPAQLEDTFLDTDDLDWLFSGDNPCTQAKKRLKSECDSKSCSSSSTLWQTHARFLPEVDVHTLPFTVPFA